MNEAYLAKSRRSAELEAMTSAELAKMIQARGWEIGGRQNKTNRKLAILHLEKHKIHEEIVSELQLRRIAPMDKKLKSTLAMIKPGMEFILKRGKAAPNKEIEIRAIVDGEWYVYRWYSKKLGPQYGIMELAEIEEKWKNGTLIPNDPEQFQ